MDEKKTLVTLIVAFSITGGGSEKVSRIGNEIQASFSGVDVSGATFLQRDIILKEGVLFAYSAFFRSNKPVRFQVWRPIKNHTDSSSIPHRLLAETRTIPSIILGREDVYIESRLTEKCIRVQEGDRLGVLFEESPGSISYVFDDKSPTALGNRLQNVSDPYVVGDIVTFDALLFPYDFSVAAYVDLDPSHYANVDPDLDFVDCFPHVLIPKYNEIDRLTTTTEPVTGAPGATGATGPVGPPGVQGPVGTAGARGPAGSVGATGQVGATGSRGADGVVGATGPRGEAGVKGDTGAQGPQGERGERGPQGPHGPPGKVIHTDGSSSTGGDGHGNTEIFSSSKMSLSYLIWLIFLTVVVIVLFIVIFIVLRKYRDGNRPLDAYTKATYPSNTSLDNAEKGSACWKDYLREETGTTYSSSTLRKEVTSMFPPSPKSLALLEKSVPSVECIGDQSGINYSNSFASQRNKSDSQSLDGIEIQGRNPENMKDENETTYSNDTVHGLLSAAGAVDGQKSPDARRDNHGGDECFKGQNESLYSNSTIQDEPRGAKDATDKDNCSSNDRNDGARNDWPENMKDEGEATFSNSSVQMDFSDVGKKGTLHLDLDYDFNETSDSWRSCMKDETETIYSNSTLERLPSRTVTNTEYSVPDPGIVHKTESTDNENTAQHGCDNAMFNYEPENTTIPEFTY